MKTAGVFTFHRAWNYGACLQAMATVEAFRAIDVNARIADYVNPYEQAGKHGAVAFLKNALLNKKKYAERAFESELCGSNHPVFDKAALNSIDEDILVAGSDQIWNPEITGGLDDAFFLRYGKCKRKIAYGPSVGSHVYTPEEQNKLKNWLDDFHAIGVRDSFAAEQIAKCTQVPIQKVCDPTILLTREQWHEWSATPEETVEKPYALLYLVGGQLRKYRTVLNDYLPKIKTPVYYMQVSSLPAPGVRTIRGANLREFVGLIENADMVITDSFHGSAFALNMGTPLLAVDNVHNPVRVRRLLSETGMTGCLLPESMETVFETDYAEARRCLDRERVSSLEWLKSNCVW